MSRRTCYLGIAGLISAYLLCVPASHAASIRIMHVGDSDVSGFQGYASYRYDLWFMLKDAGYNVDFVGTKIAPISFVNEELYPAYEQFDSEHDGRYGKSLSEISSSAAELAQASDPHIVLFLASNDLCDFGTGAVSLAGVHFRGAIDNMRAVNPHLHFLLGQIYPYDYPGCATASIPDYNQAIAQVASAKNTSRSRVVPVDHYTGFNSVTMYDGNARHANRQGEMFLAGNWFDALETIIPLVEPEPVDESIAINAGLNDAWYNPATPGQGFFITVFPDIEMMFLAWFTYDTERPAGNAQANLGEPGHRWLTAFGPYADNVADLEIELTSGGVFNARNPAAGSVADGTIMIDFGSCNAATVIYDIISAGVSGEIPIERIALDNVPACEALANR